MNLSDLAEEIQNQDKFWILNHISILKKEKIMVAECIRANSYEELLLQLKAHIKYWQNQYFKIFPSEPKRDVRTNKWIATIIREQKNISRYYEIK